MMALIVFTTTIVAMYIFDIAFGAAFDQMHVTFNATLSGMALPAAWNTTALVSLARWQFVYKSVVIIVIAVGVWVVLTIIGVEDYMREQR
jgi:hypothetical protein